MTDNMTPQDETLPIDQAMQLAVLQHQAGQLQEAENLYRLILQAQPQHQVANHNLGVLAVQLKQPAVGLPFFEAALAANPGHAQYWLSYIDALTQSGMPDAAHQVLELMRQQGVPEQTVQSVTAQLAEGSGTPAPL